MKTDKVYFGFIEGDVLQSAFNLVEYLKEDEMGDFIFCDEEKEQNHIFLDIQRVEDWLNELPVHSRIYWRLSVGLYVSLFLLILVHWGWHSGVFDNIKTW